MEYDGFVFTHIPKCGGSSLRRLIYQNAISSAIGSAQIYVPGEGGTPHDKNIGQLSPEELKELKAKGIRVLADHSKYNQQLYESLGLINPFVFTVVRAPFERFISHYNFFFKKIGHGKLKDKPIENLSKKKLEQIVKQQANVQAAYMLNIQPGYEQEDQIKARIDELITTVTQQVNVIGTLDDLTACLAHIEQLRPDWLQWTAQLPQINTNEYKLDFTGIKRVRQVFAQYNQIDIRLYQLMKSVKNLKKNGV